MSDDSTSLIDDDHARCLCDVGGRGYVAATAVSADGSTHLLLALVDAIGDETVRYDHTTPQAPHEQLGALPLEFVRRITVSRRTHRCGRRTKSGTACRTPVARPGAACAWHRTAAPHDDHTNRKAMP